MFNVPPLQCLIQFQVASYFWGVAFRCSRVKLAEHRKKVIDKISLISLNKLPLKISNYLKQGVFLLEQAFYEMFQFEEVYQSFCPFDLYSKSNVYFPLYYFTVEGRFDDVTWVKRFIYDTKISIASRFRFACSYCFENDICILFRELKGGGFVRSNRNLDELDLIGCPLVYLWIHKIENNLEEYIENAYTNTDEIFHTSNFWRLGFLEAVGYGYEQATYYFWHNLPYTEKDNLIRSNYFYGMIENASKYDRFKIVYFLYNQLSETQKSVLFYRSWQNIYLPPVWFCLLESPLTHSSFFQEILQAPFTVSVEVQRSLISYMIEKRIQFKHPIFKKTILVLWEKLPKEERFDVFGYNNLFRLVHANDLDTVGLFIKGMPFDEKEKYLRSRIDEILCCLDELSFLGKYDLLQEYLSFFLVFHEFDTEVVHKNAMLILQNLIQSPRFDEWFKGLPETEKIEVYKTTDALQSSLTVINQLFNQFV